ncbi:MAG: AEC family transporter [Thermovirgaceae bacterium]
MHGFNVVLSILVVISLGYGLRRIGILDSETIPKITGMLFWVILPVLLFRTVLTVGMQVFSNLNLFLVVHLAFLVLPPFSSLASSLFRKDKKRLAVSALVSVRTNDIYMGIPVVTLVFGQEGFEVLSLFFAVGLVGYNLIPILWAQIVLTGSFAKNALISTCSSLAKNSLIWGCLLGLLASLIGISSLPLWLDSAFEILGNTASGLALLILGASLKFNRLKNALLESWWDVTVKLLLHPLLILLLFTVIPAEPLVRKTMVLIACMPAAINNFVVANGMGMDGEYAAEAVAAGTLLSLISVPVWIHILSS